MMLDPLGIAPLCAVMNPAISASKGPRGGAEMRRAPRGAGNQKRQAIIDACRRMNALGLTRAHRAISASAIARAYSGRMR